MRNGKKTLLVLGGIAALCDIIENAQKKGIYVIVTDYYPDSPAKKIADESWMLSIDDVDGIVEKAKECGVDGVMNYCVDPGQKPYQQICERLGLPCVAGFEQFDIMTNKDKFKKCCMEHGVDTVEEYFNGSEITDECIQSLPLPLVVKPVDGRASKGLSVCKTRDELPKAIDYAMAFSKRKQIVIEKYMAGCPEVQVKYLACDGEFFMTSISDWHSAYTKDGTRVYVDLLKYPSRFMDEYLRTANQKVVDMLKSIGIRNGAMALTALYDEGKFRFFDPALRMGGAQDWRIVRAATGFDISDTLTNFALTGSMGDIQTIRKIDKAFANKQSCLQYFDICTGTIAQICGIEQASRIPHVTGYLQCHKAGDTISGYGTTDNIAMRFMLTCDSLEQLKTTMKAVSQCISVIGTDGKSMLIEPFDPERLEG